MSKLNKKLVKSIAKELGKSALLSEAYLNSVAGGGGPETGYSTGANGIYGNASVVPQGYIPVSGSNWPKGGRGLCCILPRREGERSSIPCFNEDGKKVWYRVIRLGGRLYINPIPED